MLYKIVKVKVFLLFVTAQVLYQFTNVLESTSLGEDESNFPEPALTFVNGLALCNLEVMSLFPIRCVLPHASTYYHKLVAKTIAPLVAVLVIWIFCLSRATPKTKRSAVATAAGLSFLLLELALPNVSTAICGVFRCVEYDTGHFLAADLRLPCDGLANRNMWLVYAGTCFVLYPVAVPSLFFVILYCIRKPMNRVMREVKGEASRIPVGCRRGAAEVARECLKDDPRYQVVPHCRAL